MASRVARSVSVLLLASSFGIGVVLGSPPAGADAHDESMAAGLQKFDQGRQAYEAAQFERALAAFQASYELLASPNTRLYIGRCHRALGKTASAYTSFRLAAREAQDRLATTGEKRFAATHEAADLEAADIEPKVPRLTIAVPSGGLDGLVVRINGTELPKAAWGIAVETDPGDVVVEASGPRRVAFMKKMSLAEGEQERVDVNLPRVPTATIVIRMRTRPAGVAVSLDEAPIDATEGERAVDIGSHRVVVKAPGYADVTWTKELVDGERETIDVDLHAEAPRSPKGAPPWIFFTVAGGSVAAVAVASEIAVHAQSLQNQQIALDPYARDSSVRDSIRSQATIADLLFVGGGVLGAGAVVLAFLTQWRDERAPVPAAVLAPWVDPSGGGVSAHGRF